MLFKDEETEAERGGSIIMLKPTNMQAYESSSATGSHYEDIILHFWKTKRT